MAFNNNLIETKRYYSNAKLMLTGEYLVLKGALSLALPLNYGQELVVNEITTGIIEWKASENGKHWFNARFLPDSFQIIEASNQAIAAKLSEAFRYMKELNPLFLSNTAGVEVLTNANFKMNWGFGSSSTLMSNLAYWAECNPYTLNSLVFGGSGYDIACARANNPVLYRIDNNEPKVKQIAFNPPFKANIFFVWLNKKQNTRNEIARFDIGADYTNQIEIINRITTEMITCVDLDHFVCLVKEHESVMSGVLGLPTIQTSSFSYFPGAVKSLGAWGGDFILAVSELSSNETKKYFNQKGFNTVIGFEIVMHC